MEGNRAGVIYGEAVSICIHASLALRPSLRPSLSLACMMACQPGIIFAPPSPSIS